MPAILEWNQYVVVNVERDVFKKTAKVANLLKNMVKESMGKSGFPRIITGKLKNSITDTKIDRATYEVGSDVSYAPHVEYGTSHSAPYPYFRPNINRLKGRIKGVYE